MFWNIDFDFELNFRKANGIQKEVKGHNWTFVWLFFELQAMGAVHSLERSLNTAKGKFEALLDVMLCWNPVVTLSSVWPLIIGIQVIILFMIVV